MKKEKAEKIKRIRQARDIKARPHLEQYAPVWIVDEESVLEDDALFFDAIFHHPTNGWVQRRYRFDAFNNVLYYFGQTLVDEEKALELEEQKPYMTAEVINTIDSYGG